MNTIEKNKALCEEMPYLIPRSIWSDEVLEDYDYSYIRGDYELPDGWKKLFLQMCKDIRQPLIDENYLNKFRFSQIKEKYGTMRCYNFGATKEVQRIIDKYEYISQFVCERCGKPAKYLTTGWIEEYCEDCIRTTIKPEYIKECKKIEFRPIMKITRFSQDGDTTEEFDCGDEWRRLYE